jgi:hypothetical protein
MDGLQSRANIVRMDEPFIGTPDHFVRLKPKHFYCSSAYPEEYAFRIKNANHILRKFQDLLKLMVDFF